MFRRTLSVLFLFFVCSLQSKGQACTTLGQTPQTAFPVCSDETFFQSDVPSCSNHTVPVPCNDGTTYVDYNPFWYSFTCYQAGSLGLLISPLNQHDDYDWQLFDVTGHDPGDVYTDKSLFVTGNWSGSSGETGTTPTNTNNISCSSNPADNVTTFSKLPELIEAHKYLLLVSHFSGLNQSGYSLTFGGGTAIIADLVKPELVAAKPNCSGQKISIKLSKKMKCSSLEPGGSDFALSTPSAKIITATGVGCANGFDMDSLVLTLDKPLPPGNFLVAIKNGLDGNTLLDNCDNPVPDTSLPFTVYPIQPTPMDSLTAVACLPAELRLVFKNAMQCTSVAADGSDFIINGSVPVSVIGAYGDSCNDGISTIIKVRLSQPIRVAGNFRLTLKRGADGNTLIDECGQETLPASLDFNTAAPVSAAFIYKVDLGCVYDTLYYAHDGKSGVNKWSWVFDADGTSNARDSFFLFKTYGNKHITLKVSNDVCTDSSAADIVLDNELVARFNVSPSPESCPGDPIEFIDSSIGKIASWYWTFGDGTTSPMQNPSVKYYPAPLTREGAIYPASLIVQNDIGCFDTAQQNIKIYYNCYIAVPSAFTPNGDGLNDYLYPLDAYKADDLRFRVFNRWGQLVFETKDWTKKWDGKINGQPQQPGTYVWTLSYKNRDTGKLFSLKGTTVLIR